MQPSGRECCGRSSGSFAGEPPERSVSRYSHHYPCRRIAIVRYARVWLLVSASVCPLLASGPQDVFDAIRNNDLTRLSSLVAGGKANVADERGTTPLHY